MTHYEQIQRKNLEGLAEFLNDMTVHCEKYCTFVENGRCNSCSIEDCPKGIRQWLESEV